MREPIDEIDKKSASKTTSIHAVQKNDGPSVGAILAPQLFGAMKSISDVSNPFSPT